MTAENYDLRVNNDNLEVNFEFNPNSKSKDIRPLNSNLGLKVLGGYGIYLPKNKQIILEEYF